MELFIALVLFIGLVVCWLVLPDKAGGHVAQREIEVGGRAVEQLA